MGRREHVSRKTTTRENSPSDDVSVMWKTVSEDCNLACDYCYYSTCGGKPGGEIQRVEEAVLESFIRNVMERNKRSASFAWQGGEPLLAGLDFFEKVIELQQKYTPPQMIIANSLQTNGTLITKEWAEFFKKHGFLIGVSLDGVQDIHDSHRVYSNGSGSFNQVMRGIRHLQEQQVDFNILTVLHKGNVGKAAEILNNYMEQGFYYIQFIPCMDFRSQQPDMPPQFLITPQEYGQFLCDVFDVWYQDGQPSFSERFFDNLFGLHVGYPSGSCIHGEVCPKMLVLESNGDAYPCDFFINDSYLLGNVSGDTLESIHENTAYKSFSQMKQSLPETCRSCEFIQLCHGGCPRNRRWANDDALVLPDVFCESYKMIYRYSYERMQQLVVSWRKQRVNEWLMRGRALPGRNDDCLCGSGRKYKKCCAQVVV